MAKIKLLGLTLEQIETIVLENKLPKFTAKQITNWIYQKRVRTIDEMSNLSKKARELLNQSYEVGIQLPTHQAASVDGTKKYLFPSTHGDVEAVYIPEKERATLCISCQVGCKMNCHFCMTGKQGWSGSLSTNEILNQVYAIPESEKLTNIVYMGMGEPFDNTLAILNSLKILSAPWGLAWSPRRITVSTIGVIPGMKQFLEHSEAHLAVSLHNPFPEERLTIMPTEKAYPIEKVIETLKKYDFAHQRRVSFEYIIFKGKNDSPRHAAQLIKLLKDLPCRINIIRFHPVPGIDLVSPDEDKIIWFRDYLTTHGITSTIRRSRGLDIFAACGLLSSNQQNR